MIDQMEEGLYNVKYHNKNDNKGTFEVNAIAEGDKYKIVVSNIQYDGYVSNWQVKYKLSDVNYWSTSDKLEFYIDKPGEYDINVVHGDEISLGTKKLNLNYENEIGNQENLGNNM